MPHDEERVVVVSVNDELQRLVAAYNGPIKKIPMRKRKQESKDQAPSLFQPWSDRLDFFAYGTDADVQA